MDKEKALENQGSKFREDMIENGGSECPMPVEEYQPMYQRNQDLWAAVACLYKNS